MDRTGGRGCISKPGKRGRMSNGGHGPISELNQAYRLGFRSVGRDVMIWPHAHIVGAEHISIGDSVIIDDFVFIMASEPTEIGSFIHIASGATIVGGGRLEMGDFSAISGGARVFTGNDDYLGGGLVGPAVPQEFRFPERSFVTFSNHSIVGANSVVLPGVTLAEGAAAGALTFVNKDLDPWMVYAGSPARAVKERPRSEALRCERLVRERYFDDNGRYIVSADRK